ncbi:tRNA (adenosine(37)-N6)-threonylcarbamoyltransferase complex ATPase subunit type 1 TsaE [Candidatus Pacebacteria bacterium]|nr:tRNA (adenosine(37)-N6)-threonylcarbamoyltransferase complex ATPase subunit type 1 TsaE [Candidatus Paceibacterota bacterium]
MKEYRVRDVNELPAVAKEVILLLEERQRKDGGAASVLALHGDLGAGKTTFMQLLAAELGVTQMVTSPTFVLMKKYETQHSSFANLTHIDAYRIEDIDEMRPLRFTEELEQKGTIIGIEWAEKIASLLPPDTLHIQFEMVDETRVITINGKGN